MKQAVFGIVAASIALVSLPARARCPSVDTLAVGDECKRFGESGDGFLPDWASQLPPFFVTVGARSLAYVPSHRESFDGNVESSPLAYSFAGDALGSSPLHAYGLETSVGWMMTPFTTLGVSLALGEGGTSAGNLTANALAIQPRDSLNVTLTNFGGVLGLRLPLGVVSLRTDMFLGGQWIDLDQYASNSTNRLTSTASSTAFLAEPRFTVDVWATPFVTVSAFAAAPDFDLAATTGGLLFAGHLRAFDGRYGL